MDWDKALIFHVVLMMLLFLLAIGFAFINQTIAFAFVVLMFIAGLSSVVTGLICILSD